MIISITYSKKKILVYNEHPFLSLSPPGFMYIYVLSGGRGVPGSQFEINTRAHSTIPPFLPLTPLFVHLGGGGVFKQARHIPKR